MNKTETNCEHACKNTCNTLVEAVKLQKNLVHLYNNALTECSIPDINILMNRMIASSQTNIDELNLKLNEIKSASGIIDDIEESYDKN